MSGKYCCEMGNTAAEEKPVRQWTCTDWRHMFNGYATPATIALVIMALVAGSIAISACVIRDRPSDTWRMAVSAVFVALCCIIGPLVLISYYRVIFSRPGYVGRDPWRYRPHFVIDESMVSAKQRETLAALQTPNAEHARAGAHDTPNPLTSSNNSSSHHDGMKCDAVLADATSGGTPSGSQESQGNRVPVQTTTPAEDGKTDDDTGADEAGRNPYVVTQVDRWGNLRYCKYCELYKPDGAYHCGVCGHCVYRFDHHCLWINNCVGRNNYKLFVCFLMTAGLGCDIGAILDLIIMFAVNPRPIKERLPWLVLPIFLLLIGIALTGFWIEHRYWMCLGKSTVEDIIGDRIREEKKRLPPGERAYTAAERVYVEAKNKEQIEEHIRGLWGNETGFKAIIAYSVRTDDTPEGCRMMQPESTEA